MKNRTILFAFLFFAAWSIADAGSIPARPRLSPAESVKRLQKDPHYADISNLPSVKLDLKYATTDNFMGVNLYGPVTQAFLHKGAALKFQKAIQLLKKAKPAWSFVIFDALRPRSVQWKMWDKVKDTPNRKYVADAEKGSNHNFGMALDLGLLGENGKLVDMGTPFDSFSQVSEPRLEVRLLREGKLTQRQLDNRLILRGVMTKAGFLQLSHEWWHYNALPEDVVRKKYKIVE